MNDIQITERFLRPKDAAKMLGVSRATLYTWAREKPDFPKPIKRGPKITLWRLTELQDWMENGENWTDESLRA